jgi:hypothetical protein
MVEMVRKNWNRLETMVIEWNKIFTEAEHRTSKAYA